jgi:molybdenum cofactor cytidylyltransferase
MKVKHTNTAMIILAAGESNRMGAVKQNLPWKKTTLLGHVIEQGSASNIDEVFVVVGANAKSVINKISGYDITIIRNGNWQSGMGTSIACAMQNFDEKSLHFDAVIITLSDQPLIDSKHYNVLIDSIFKNNKTIISTQINNRAGVPAIFASKHFNALSKLDKDYGARKILSSNSEEILTINIGDNTVDIDTMDSYKSLYETYGME